MGGEEKEMKKLILLTIVAITVSTVTAGFLDALSYGAVQVGAEAAVRSAVESAESSRRSDTSDSSESKRGDYRVRRALKNAGINFTVDNSNDFRMTWKVGDEGRTQLAVVNSNTENWAGGEWRDVYAFGYKGKPLEQEKLVELLRFNSTRKIGAWELIVDDAGTWFLRHRVVLPADASSEELSSASQVVAVVADELEQKLLGTDNL